MKKNVLLVDDEKNILSAYQRNLSEYYNIETADSGDAAINLIRGKGPFQVVVSDYKMPGMNGVELLEKVKEISPETIQIMLTGQADMGAIANLINKGKIFRFLTKPCSGEDLINNVNEGIKLYELASMEKELLGKTLGGSIKVLADLLALAKPQAFYKTQSIRALAKKIYSVIGQEDIWQIEIASLLSQIGCVTIPDDILKKVYRGLLLSDKENVMFANHPEVGAGMIKSIPRMEKVAEIIKYQEKNYDGSGFPHDEVKGEMIPPGARILKIVIDYDRLISVGQESEKALSDMKKRSGMYDDGLLAFAMKKLLQKGGEGRKYIIKEVPIAELNNTMYLADDLVTASGSLIGGKNQKLNEALITAVKNYAGNEQLKDKIKVVVSIE